MRKDWWHENWRGNWNRKIIDVEDLIKEMLEDNINEER